METYCLSERERATLEALLSAASVTVIISMNDDDTVL